MSRGTPSAPAAGLVVRFALTSLAVFALVGFGIWWFRARDVRQREERSASSASQLLATEVLAPDLWGADLSTPFAAARHDLLQQEVSRVIAADPAVVRVKLWSTDGTVLYSNDPHEIGSHLGLDDDLREAFGGSVSSDVSDLTASENVGERPLATKLFETYVPLRRSPGGRVMAVAEVYRDYSAIQTEVDRLTTTLAVSLTAGLLVLFALLLPVMVGLTRRLRRQNEQLARLLTGEQATVAELRELDRLKGDFVAAASHELRTPLTSIRGYAHLLKGTLPPGDEIAAEALQAIERQTSRMLRLVTNLLREARIEHEPPADNGVFAFDVGALVQEVAADFLGEGDRIRAVIPADLPPVRCDRGRVGDVLTNLLDNALKYGPPDAPVSVGGRVEDGALVLWVHDDGEGIEPQEVPRLFEPFYQADGSATRSHGGVGLGLHIVRGLLDFMGGSIEVDTPPSGGSTFRFRVPLVVDPEPSRAVALG